MAIKGVLRAGMVQVRVLEMEPAIVHYRDRLGLNLVGMTSDGRAMLKGYDEFDHHSVVLRLADSAGLDFMGFKLDSEATLAEMEAKIKAEGYPVENIAAESDQPGFGRRVAVTVPTGHRIDLYAEVAMAEDIPQIKNPDIWQREPHGMKALGFDHALLYGPNAAGTVKFFTEILGLAKVEVAQNPAGEDFVTWLTANNKSHDVAVLEHPQPGALHHIAFKLETWGDIGHAADLISVYNISLDAGPMRHGITRGQTIYFFDPSGNRNETYAGGYAHYPDHPVRVWDFDHVGKGVFYYTRELNERFLSVYS